MATLNQIAERIAIALGKEDNIPFQEAVKFSVLHYRAVYIRRDVEKNEISDGYLQTVTLPLISVDRLDNIGMVSGKLLKRTTSKIPSPIRQRLKDDFKFVGSILTGETFERHDITSINNLRYRRGTSPVIAYDYVDGYIYVFDCDIQYVTIRAAFEDPRKAGKDGEFSTCFTDDSELPIPADIVQYIIDGLISNELKLINNNQSITVNEKP